MDLSADLISGYRLVRTNRYKLVHCHCHYDFRKFNCTNLIILIWNSLFNHVVSADTVNLFKSIWTSVGPIRMYCTITRQICMASVVL